MQKYSIDFSKKALKYYARLDTIKRNRIDEIMSDFEKGLFDTYDITKMKGEPEGTFRLRFGDFRITYEKHDKVLYIFVLKIGPRGDVYKS